MTATLIDTHTPGSVGWHQQRTTAVGGSEVAALLGLSPWESRFSLWHRKRGAVPPIDDTPVMEWGRRLEPVVLEKWTEDHEPVDVTVATTWLADGWRLANPDAIATMSDGSRVIVEIKTARSDESWDEGPPVYYLCQVQWYMGVLDLDVAHVAVLIGGSDYREFVVERCQDDIHLMAKEARAFLDSIDADEQPEIDDSYVTFQTLRQLHPDIDGTDHELPHGLANQLIQARHTHDAAKAEWQLAQSLVLAHMGTARNAVRPDGQRVAYRMARKTPAGDLGTPFLAIDRRALK